MGLGRAPEGGASRRQRQMVQRWPCTMPLGCFDTSVLAIDAMIIKDATDGAGNDDGEELEGHFHQIFRAGSAIMQLVNVISSLLIKIYD
eukprot:7220801-Ditylum_brightwellii.AAC.1